MLGGGALIFAFTSNSFAREGKMGGASDLRRFSPKLKDGAGGGGGGSLGPPSKKSSIVGKLGSSPPGPKRLELLLLLFLILLFLLLLLLLFEKKVFTPLSLSNLFLISNSFPGWLGSDLIKSLSDWVFLYLFLSTDFLLLDFLHRM